MRVRTNQSTATLRQSTRRTRGVHQDSRKQSTSRTERSSRGRGSCRAQEGKRNDEAEGARRHGRRRRAQLLAAWCTHRPCAQRSDSGHNGSPCGTLTAGGWAEAPRALTLPEPGLQSTGRVGRIPTRALWPEGAWALAATRKVAALGTSASETRQISEHRRGCAGGSEGGGLAAGGEAGEARRTWR